MDGTAVSIAFTGHRPVKLACGYDESHPVCLRVKERLEKLIRAEAVSCGRLRFLTGMAMGTDIWAAELVLKVRASAPEADVELVCAVPYEGHIEVMADEGWRRRYRTVLAAAAEVRVLAPSFTRSCMEERDRWMVDHADRVIAVLNEARAMARIMEIAKLPPEQAIPADSGTAVTVRYALSLGKPVTAIDPKSGCCVVHFGADEKRG